MLHFMLLAGRAPLCQEDNAATRLMVREHSSNVLTRSSPSKGVALRRLCSEFPSDSWVTSVGRTATITHSVVRLAEVGGAGMIHTNMRVVATLYGHQTMRWCILTTRCLLACLEP